MLNRLRANHDRSNTIVGSGTPGNGVWRYVTVSFTPGSHVLYMDGQQIGTSSTTDVLHDNSAIPFNIGGWQGVCSSAVHIDELRLSNTVRSAAWVATEYANMANTSAFLTIQSSSQSVPRTIIHGGVIFNGGSGSQ